MTREERRKLLGGVADRAVAPLLAGRDCFGTSSLLPSTEVTMGDGIGAAEASGSTTGLIGRAPEECSDELKDNPKKSTEHAL